LLGLKLYICQSVVCTAGWEVFCGGVPFWLMWIIYWELRVKTKRWMVPTRVGKYVKTGSIVWFTLTGDRRGIYAENFTL